MSIVMSWMMSLMIIMMMINDDEYKYDEKDI